MTDKGDAVLDPFLGTGTSVIAAIKNDRRGIGAETRKEYIAITHQRIKNFTNGTLKTRPMNKPIYEPAHEHGTRFRHESPLGLFASVGIEP